MTCLHEISQVTDSRKTTLRGEIVTRRRRYCSGCKAKFTTYETVLVLEDLKQTKVDLRDMVHSLRRALDEAQAVLKSLSSEGAQ